MSPFIKSQKDKGFTLIELLVVVAIISLLASVVFSATDMARSRARDARRKSDFRQIQTALELYYQQVGFYPGTGSTSSMAGIYANSAGPSWTTRLETPLVTQGVISSVPRDPVNVPSGAWPWGIPAGASVNRLYHYRSNGTADVSNATLYLLCTWLEDPNDPARLGVRDIPDPFNPSNLLYANTGYSQYNYCVSSPL